MKNYEPVSLISVLYEMFAKIISNITSATLDYNKPRTGWLQEGYYTVHYIDVISEVTEKSAVYHQPFTMAFINYEKAFYSVDIPAFIEAMVIMDNRSHT